MASLSFDSILPLGIAFHRESGYHVCTSFRDKIFSLRLLNDRNLISIKESEILEQSTLTLLMKQGNSQIDKVMEELKFALQDSECQEAILPQSAISLKLPIQIGDYTDFYASEVHATNVGSLFRGAENALMPNWKHIPIAYHGRASSIILSGQSIMWPSGQQLKDDEPIFGPSSKLDFEVELAAVIGKGNELGSPIPVEKAIDHIFGYVLMNDWSARDIQAWEYKPLGPFLGKNFATSISPWIITASQLTAFQHPLPAQSPEPLDYLRQAGDTLPDIEIEVCLTHDQGVEEVISTTNSRHLYWSFSQMVAHHTINGCNLRPGDLLGSGTISGREKNSWGSLLELTKNGKEPLIIGNQERTFLEDGDEVVMRAFVKKDQERMFINEVRNRIYKP